MLNGWFLIYLYVYDDENGNMVSLTEWYNFKNVFFFKYTHKINK